jgi:HEAT repeat protein
MEATRTARLRYVVRLALPAALLGVGVATALSAEAPDPVAELREELRRPVPEEPRALRAYEARLLACAKRVVRPGDLCAALMLGEWRAGGGGPRVPPGRGGPPEVQLKVRKEMAGRFQEALRQLLRKGDRVRRLAALTLVGELADAESAGAAEEGPEEGGGAPGSTTAPLAPDLVGLLGSEKDAAVRVGAVKALCKLRPEPEVLTPPLRKALGAKAVSERRAAAEGLGGLLTARPREAHAWAWVLQAGPRLVPLAGRGLKDEDAVVRRRCLGAIRQAARGLEQGIPQPSGWGRAWGLPDPGEKGAEAAHRQFAAEVWDRLAPLARSLNGQTPAVTRCLKDPDLSVCLAAHGALETIVTARHRLLQLAASLPRPRKGEKGAVDFKDALDKGADAVPQLVGSLGHKEVRVRLASLYVLETLGAAAAPAADGLARALSDKDPFVRWGAARALANMAPHGAASAVPALAKVLDDDSRDVRVTAAVALRRYGGSAGPAVGALADVVRRGDAQMRVLAIRALEAVGKGARPAVPALVKALSTEETAVRAAAARALGRLGAADRSARAALLKALDDPDADVRRAAGGALLGDA